MNDRLKVQQQSQVHMQHFSSVASRWADCTPYMKEYCNQRQQRVVHVEVAYPWYTFIDSQN